MIVLASHFGPIQGSWSAWTIGWDIAGRQNSGETDVGERVTRLRSGGLRWLLPAGLTALASLGLAGHLAAQDGTVKSQHGDWQIVCKPPPPGAKNETCALVQSVAAEDRNNVGLTIYFQRFANGTQVLRVFAPLGVLLPPGLGLKVDEQDVGSAPFLRCHTLGCYAQVTADAKLVERLSNGRSAVFVIYQTEEAGIGIPISLKGFAEALARLGK